MPSDVTDLLKAWAEGDKDALQELAPLVHYELNRLARRYMKRERLGHTLQTTALVNEAYVRLIGWKDVHWKNRAHFFGVAAQMMRRILVDYARRASVRGGARGLKVSLDEAAAVSRDEVSRVIAVDEALEQLAAISPRKSQIVELRFFGGMTVEETAEVLKIAPITVIREWNVAKAWLLREISKTQSS